MVVSSTHTEVRDYYGKKLKQSADLKTTACSAAKSPHPLIRKLLSKVPDKIAAQFYGCGAPTPLGITGLRVLDLGCGAGRDCYLASALVGEHGSVIGVDMTRNLIEVARAHVQEYTTLLGYSKPNMVFVEGHIEDLGAAGVPEGSIDLIISNCVINLCPNKDRVFREAHRALAPGGEMYFSDMYATRRLPASVQTDPELWGEGITGAQYRRDFLSRAARSGFTSPRLLTSAPITIIDANILELTKGTDFLSETYRLFRLPGLLESSEEDYGQLVEYKGNIGGCEQQFVLDTAHSFEAHKPTPVSGNTAAMLGEGGMSWLSQHFQIVGSRNQHFGAFPALQNSWRC